jgi:hypothetical protein
MNKLQLIQRVQNAFPAIPVPSDSEIVPHTTHLDLEREAIKKFLSGKTWRTLTLDRLKNDYDGDASAILSLVSHKAFHYYFPAFLMTGLTDIERSDMIFDCTIYTFFPDAKDKELKEWRFERICLFSKEQLGVTADVFTFLSLEEPNYVPAWDIEPAIGTIQRHLGRF